MSNSQTKESNEHTLEVRQWCSAWLSDNTDIGSFTQDSIQYEEQFRVEYLKPIKALAISVLSKEIAKDTYKFKRHYQEPKTWFQKLKHDKLPTWFKNIYPVIYETKYIDCSVKLTRLATYPKLNIKMPKRKEYKVTIKDSLTDNSYEGMPDDEF